MAGMIFMAAAAKVVRTAAMPRWINAICSVIVAPSFLEIYRSAHRRRGCGVSLCMAVVYAKAAGKSRA